MATSTAKNTFLSNYGTGNSFLNSYKPLSSVAATTPAAPTLTPANFSSAPNMSPAKSAFFDSVPTITFGQPTQTPTTTAAPAVQSPAKTQYVSNLAQQTATTTPTPLQTPSNTPTPTQTPTTPTTPTVDPNASYRAAFDQYLSSLKPSDAETSASKNLADLQLQAQKDNEDALNKGESLGFASGEAARVAKNNSFGIDAASNTLNALTAARGASTDATKARLDFEQGIRKDEQPQFQNNGNDIIQINPDGTTSVAYKGSPDVKTQVVQAGGKNILINTQTGAVIKELGATDSALSRAASGSTSSGTGGYTVGSNPAADNWIDLIQNKGATISNVPAALKNAVAAGLAASGNNPATGGAGATELGKKALTTAQSLLEKVNNDKGFTGAVGAKGLLSGFGLFNPAPGSDPANFKVDFDSLKSLLSLEGVKYLKGQGAVSDAERALLASATSKLSRDQSEEEFKKSLNDIIGVLSGSAQVDTGATDDPEYSAYLKSIGQ